MADYLPQVAYIFALGNRNSLHRQRDTISDNRTQRERLLVTNLQITCPSLERPIILRIQNQEKLRKVRLRKYLQKQKSRPIEYSWRFIRREGLFLRREDKSTWILLQKVNQVLN